MKKNFSQSLTFKIDNFKRRERGTCLPQEDERGSARKTTPTPYAVYFLYLNS
jgi:hypothetical protein